MKQQTTSVITNDRMGTDIQALVHVMNALGVTDFELCKAFLIVLNIPYDMEDMGGEWHVAVGTAQDTGATIFVFEEASGKFLRYETPLVENCLTKRL